MKKMILAALAAFSLGAGVASAQSLSHSTQPHQQTANQYNWLAGGD